MYTLFSMSIATNINTRKKYDTRNKFIDTVNPCVLLFTLTSEKNSY